MSKSSTKNHASPNAATVADVTDLNLTDAIATLMRFTQVHNTMPHLASYSLNYDNVYGRWELKAQACYCSDEAETIDAIRMWSTVLDDGVTRLGEESGFHGSTWRQLSALGTLGGHTQIEIWAHIAETRTA